MQSPSTSSDSELVDLPELPSISMPSTSTPKTSRLKQERPTECSICGKPAQGFHYEVESCNGCKTFFRRSIMSEKVSKCKMDGDCFDLTKRESPVKCRACRYEKCLKVGMNPLSMQIDENDAKSSKLRIIAKRKTESPPIDNVGNDGLRILKTQCSQIEQIIDSLVYLEWKVEQFRNCGYEPDWKTFLDLKGVIVTSNRINSVAKIGTMNSSEPGIKPKPGVMEEERPNGKPMKRIWFPLDLLAMVEYSKTFMFLNKLDFEDQLRLLKHTTLACMNLHISFYSVSRKSDKLIFPDGEGAIEDFKGMVYSESVMSIQPLIRYNVSKTEYILLKAILLCNPAVSDLSEHAQKIIGEQRKEYAAALFDYCLSKRELGPSHFVLLIGIIDTLEHQQRIQKNLHLLHVLPNLKNMDRSRRMLLIDDIMDN